MNNPTESKFLSHLSGILSYVSEMQEKEPTWNYDNFIEYEELKKTFHDLKTNDPLIIGSMNILDKEINIAKQKLSSRTKEEDEFFRHITGVNSYFRETNENINSEYRVVINPMELNLLLERMKDLNTQNPEIILAMKILTKDYKAQLYAKKGRKIGDKFQERLVLLGIEEEKKKGFFGR
jgi:hypothetical protein